MIEKKFMIVKKCSQDRSWWPDLLFKRDCDDGGEDGEGSNEISRQRHLVEHHHLDQVVRQDQVSGMVIGPLGEIE